MEISFSGKRIVVTGAGQGNFYIDKISLENFNNFNCYLRYW